MDVTALMLVEDTSLDDFGRPRVGAVVLGFLTMPPASVDPETWAYDVMIIWQGRPEDVTKFQIRFLVEHMADGTVSSARLEQSATTSEGPAGSVALKLPAKFLAPAPGRMRLEAAITDPAGGGTWIEYDVRLAE